MFVTFEERWRGYFTLLTFAALFALMGLGAVIYAQPAIPAEEPPRQGAPPLQPFIKQALTVEARPGDIVEYQITFNNSTSVTYTGAIVGVTDTLPSELSVLEPITVNQGMAAVVDTHLITWTGELTVGDYVTITYQAGVASDAPTTTLTNTAVLWEQRGPSDWLTPTNEVLTASMEIQVQPFWPEAYLPTISVPLPPVSIPQLGNWDFEQRNNGDWREQSNGEPGKIIYKNGEGITIILPPYEGQTNSYFAWLGGEYSAVNILEQSIALPAELNQVSLTFAAWIDSADSCGKDTAEVLVNNQVVESYDLCKDKNSPIQPDTGGWNRQTLDITQFGVLSGQPVPITFKVTTDSAKNSNWYIDNVRLCSTDEGAAAADRCP